jgi:hypothetical protein
MRKDAARAVARTRLASRLPPGTLAPALGPDRRSEFFDPKARLTPRPFLEIRRGKSGHRRAGCRTSFTASVGGARQGASTDSVTENK